jgi:PAS domain S-box-containing protein
MFSDKILLSFESDPEILSRLQSYKGWLFILVSSILIYFLTSKSIQKFILADQKKSVHIKYLEELKNKLQLAINTSRIGFWEWIPQSGKMYFSDEWKTQIGFSEKGVKHSMEEWISRIHPDDKEFIKTKLNRFFSREIDEFNTEFRFKHKKGHYLWLLTSGALIRDNQGKVKKLLGTYIDITSQKKIEEELKEKEKQLSNLIGNLKGIVYRCQNDPRWTMIFLSKGITEITGYHPEELIGNQKLAYADLIVPEDREKVFKTIQEALNIYKQFRITYRIKTKDNKEKWMWEQGVGVFNREGRLKWIEGYIADITEQKNAELALQKSEEKYKNLVENSLVGIYTTNLNGELIYANKAFCEILGYTHADEINIEELYPSIEKRIELINEIKKKDKVSNYESVLLTKLGERKNITLNASLNGNEISGMMMDTTQNKQYEKQIITAKEEAETASKIKDAFIGNISHEIRTPLNAINGFSNILKSKFEEYIDERSNEFFQIIFDASSRLERTVDMMLDYSKLNAGDMKMKPVRIDLKKIIENILEEHQVEIKKKNLEIIIVQNTKNTKIIADEYAVENAFSNIIQNAIKYTQKGHIKISCVQDKTKDFIIHVEDTGIGMASEYLDKIFTPYLQEDTGYTRQYEGVGLGLSITKKLLELNGAEIKVQSKKGKGSIFSIIFKNEFQNQVKEFSKPSITISKK